MGLSELMMCDGEIICPFWSDTGSEDLSAPLSADDLLFLDGQSSDATFSETLPTDPLLDIQLYNKLHMTITEMSLHAVSLHRGVCLNLVRAAYLHACKVKGIQPGIASIEETIGDNSPLICPEAAAPEFITSAGNQCPSAFERTISQLLGTELESLINSPKSSTTNIKAPAAGRSSLIPNPLFLPRTSAMSATAALNSSSSAVTTTSSYSSSSCADSMEGQRLVEAPPSSCSTPTQPARRLAPWDSGCQVDVCPASSSCAAPPEEPSARHVATAAAGVVIILPVYPSEPYTPPATSTAATAAAAPLMTANPTFLDDDWDLELGFQFSDEELGDEEDELFPGIFSAFGLDLGGCLLPYEDWLLMEADLDGLEAFDLINFSPEDLMLAALIRRIFAVAIATTATAGVASAGSITTTVSAAITSSSSSSTTTTTTVVSAAQPAGLAPISIPDPPSDPDLNVDLDPEDRFGIHWGDSWGSTSDSWGSICDFACSSISSESTTISAAIPTSSTASAYDARFEHSSSSNDAMPRTPSLGIKSRRSSSSSSIAYDFSASFSPTAFTAFIAPYAASSCCSSCCPDSDADSSAASTTSGLSPTTSSIAPLSPSWSLSSVATTTVTTKDGSGSANSGSSCEASSSSPSPWGAATASGGCSSGSSGSCEVWGHRLLTNNSFHRQHSSSHLRSQQASPYSCGPSPLGRAAAARPLPPYESVSAVEEELCREFGIRSTELMPQQASGSLELQPCLAAVAAATAAAAAASLFPKTLRFDNDDDDDDDHDFVKATGHQQTGAAMRVGAHPAGCQTEGARPVGCQTEGVHPVGCQTEATGVGASAAAAVWVTERAYGGGGGGGGGGAEEEEEEEGADFPVTGDFEDLVLLASLDSGFFSLEFEALMAADMEDLERFGLIDWTPDDLVEAALDRNAKRRGATTSVAPWVSLPIDGPANRCV